MTDLLTTIAIGEDHPELREAIRRICNNFPGFAFAHALGLPRSY